MRHLGNNSLGGALKSTDGSIALGELWSALGSGRLLVQRAFDTAEEHVLVLQVRDIPAPPPGFKILEALLTDGSKQAALDLAVSPSTAAAKVSECLHSLGMRAVPTRLSALLYFACFAASRNSSARANAVEVDGTLRVSLRRCDAQLAEKLSPSEYAVVRLLVAGLPYREIAAKRETSTRTVANQIASAFARLGVSGRAELLRRLSFEGLEESNANPARRQVQAGELQTQFQELRKALDNVRTAVRGTHHERALEAVDAQIMALERQIGALEAGINLDRAMLSGAAS